MGKRVNTGLIYIDGDPKECDFCDNNKICASIDTLGGVMIICQDCLKEFVEAFNKEDEEIAWEEEDYLEECFVFLEFFNVDYSGDIIYLTNGGNSCLANPTSQFYKTFAGASINQIAEFVAKKLNKKTEWID